MPKTKKEKETNSVSKQIKAPIKYAIPIKYNIPDNIVTRFASDMVIQTIPDGFRISFFETYPEILLGEIKEENIPKEVQANCVASIVVSNEKLPKFIKALQDNYEKNIIIKSQEETWKS